MVISSGIEQVAFIQQTLGRVKASLLDETMHCFLCRSAEETHEMAFAQVNKEGAMGVQTAQPYDTSEST